VYYVHSLLYYAFLRIALPYIKVAWTFWVTHTHTHTRRETTNQQTVMRDSPIALL